MKLISSKMLFWHKRIFPVLWFGFVAVFVVFGLMHGTVKADPMQLVMPCFMAGVGFLIFRNLIWNLVDRVYDCGDSLLILNRGEECRIALSDIMNVSASTMMNPPRITLRLVRDSRFGKTIAFMPKRAATINPFASSAVADDLMERVDKARVNRTAR